MSQTVKQCSKCLITKPVTSFYGNRFKPGDFTSMCRSCCQKFKDEPREIAPRRTALKPGPKRREPSAFSQVEYQPKRFVSVKSVPIPAAVVVEPERARIEPKINIDAEKATREELAEFIERFVLEYLALNGETADEFFRHWLPHRHTEITSELVTRAINRLIKDGATKVSRWEACDLERIDFLALP